MRALSAMLFGMVLLVPAAQAQQLPAGKPAGVQKAALGTTGIILLVSAGVITFVAVAGIAMGKAQSSSRT